MGVSSGMNEESRFQHEYDPDDPAASYKPINSLAIVAMVFAVFSLLAVAFPVLTFINLLAAVLAIISIRQINQEPRYVGITMARFALFLAVFAATISLGYFLGRSAYLNSIARSNAEHMIRLFYSGDYGEAYDLSLAPVLRQPEGTDLRQFYNQLKPVRGHQQPPKLEILTWLAQVPLSLIEEDQRKGKFRFLGFDDFKLTDPMWKAVACEFEYEPASKDVEKPTFQMIMMRRNYADKKVARWRFLKFEYVAGPKPEEGMVEIGGPSKKNDRNRAK